MGLKVYLISLYGWCNREVRKVFTIWNQTILGPFSEGLMTITIFSIFFKHHNIGTDYNLGELFGGVTCMIIIRNAFSNSCSPLIISKLVGYVYDYIALPFAALNIIVAACAAGIMRCLCIGTCYIIAAPLFGMELVHPLLFYLFITLVAMQFSLIGLMFATKCNTFEQVSTVSSYIIAPFSMFSGTFFPIKYMPLFIQKIALYNPFFYAVDMVKYCFTGNCVRPISFEIKVFLGMILLSIAIVQFMSRMFVQGRFSNLN